MLGGQRACEEIVASSPERKEPRSAPDRKIQSLKALRKEVERWNDHYSPKMTKQEVEDVVTYLNETFYKFK